MVTSLLLLAVLFLAGLVNIYFYFSPKKFSAWLPSFFPNTSSGSSGKASSDKGRRLTSESKKVELKRVFATFDRNGDGFITKQELRESLKNIRMFITEKEVEDMVVKVDANGDGLIDFDEFCILCHGTTGSTAVDRGSRNDNHQEGNNSLREINGAADEEEVHDADDDEGSEEELKEAFDVFDKDKDGLISVEELGSVLCSLGLKEGNKMEDCKAMIRKVDMDGDGMVNFDEFKRMMKSSGGGLVSIPAF